MIHLLQWIILSAANACFKNGVMEWKKHRLGWVVLGCRDIDKATTTGKAELAANNDWEENPPDDEQDKGEIEGGEFAEVVGSLVLIVPRCISSYVR